MDEAYLENLINKINSGALPESWLLDIEKEPTEPHKPFCLSPPRRLWEQIRLLPSYRAGVFGSGRGRPRQHSPKKMLTAILTKAFEASSWREIEKSFGIPAMTVHDQFRRWKKSGLFEEIPKLRVQCHQKHHSIDWTWIKHFDKFMDHIEPEREPRATTTSKEDEKMFRVLSFTARGTPRKNRIRPHLLRKVRDHFHQSA